MSQPSVKFHRKVFSAAIITLLLWLNGFGCAMCCEKDAADAHCNNEAIAASQPNSSATAPIESESACRKEASDREESDCCKKPVSKSSEQVNSSSTEGKEAARQSETTAPRISRQGTVVACSLLPKNFPGLTVAPKSAVQADSEIASGAAHLAIRAQVGEPPFIPPTLPQNRGGTYLRCCVFLI